METEFFNADGRTDMNLIVDFLNFSKNASCWNGAIEAMSVETILLVEMVYYFLIGISMVLMPIFESVFLSR